MKKFIRKTLLMFIPFVYLLIVYIYMDPFKVIYNYDNYYEHTENGYVSMNKDYISTKGYEKNHEKEEYDSFIFGNSRSILYHVDEWKKYIGADAKCYHFDANGESLYSIQKKIRYIDENGGKLKNVMMILDYETMIQDKPRSGHLYVISPQLTHYMNIITFHSEFFTAFLSPKFLYAYLDFRFSGKVKDYMKEEFLIYDVPVKYSSRTNEILYYDWDSKIERNQFYTPEYIRKEFYMRDSIQHYDKVSIAAKQKSMLSDIKSIFKKQNSQYKIIINPLYNQQKLNPQDLAYLEQVFGKENVFDFSGINPITSDYRNYYEKSHYRPGIASGIMKAIYSNSPN